MSNSNEQFFEQLERKFESLERMVQNKFEALEKMIEKLSEENSDILKYSVEIARRSDVLIQTAAIAFGFETIADEIENQNLQNEVEEQPDEFEEQTDEVDNEKLSEGLILAEVSLPQSQEEAMEFQNQVELHLMKDNEIQEKKKKKRVTTSKRKTTRIEEEVECANCKERFFRFKANRSLSHHARNSSCLPFKCSFCPKMYKKVSLS